MIFTLIAASAGVVFGLIGATLGVVNFVRALSRERIYVKLIPVCDYHPKMGNRLSVTIINLSVFPVTIEQVVLEIQPVAKFSGQSITFGDLGGVQLPNRLESRASFTVTFPPADKIEDFHRVVGVYAETACGNRFDAPVKSFLPIIETIKNPATARART